MKTRLMLLTLFLVPSASAQLPVIDAAAIAKAVAALVELREQVRLLNQSLSETKAIREVSTDHFARYEQSLTKRGIVESQPLLELLQGAESALEEAPGYLDPDALGDLYVLYEAQQDPLAYDRTVMTRSMDAVGKTLEALSAHGEQMHSAHDELARFKREISASREPLEMLDVQASLQVLAAREALQTRQALMVLSNLEAIEAARALNEKAQRRAVYHAFIGGTNWLGDPKKYRMSLRMPGQ